MGYQENTKLVTDLPLLPSLQTFLMFSKHPAWVITQLNQFNVLSITEIIPV